MERTEGVTYAALVAQIQEVRNDVTALVNEELRTRRRLHDLEGIAGTLVSDLQARRRDEKRSRDRFQRRIQVLTLVVALAAIVVPTVVTILATR